MKIVKVIASFFILMLIGIFISYGDTDNSGYDKFWKHLIIHKQILNFII